MPDYSSILAAAMQQQAQARSPYQGMNEGILNALNVFQTLRAQDEAKKRDKMAQEQALAQKVQAILGARETLGADAAARTAEALGMPDMFGLQATTQDAQPPAPAGSSDFERGIETSFLPGAGVLLPGYQRQMQPSRQAEARVAERGRASGRIGIAEQQAEIAARSAGPASEATRQEFAASGFKLPASVTEGAAGELLAKLMLSQQEGKNALAKVGAEAKAKGLMGGLDPKQRLDAESKLYDDFMGNQTVKEFSAVRDATRNMRAMAQSRGGAFDIGTVYTFIRALDPASAVKEGEVRLSEQAVPGVSRVALAYNSLVKGRITTDQFNKQVGDAVEKLYNEKRKGVEPIRKAVMKRAERYQLPTDFLPDIEIPAGEQAGQPLTVGRFQVVPE